MTGKIIPIKKKCGCGRRIVHHHKYCDKCWELREKVNRPTKWNKGDLKEEIKRNNKLLGEEDDM